jgi:isoleucyl-tRNA synthetase
VVALDLTLNDALRLRGLVRDVVRQVQDLRKASGLEVSDRIVLQVTGLNVLIDFFDEIAREVLATEVVVGQGEGEGTALELELNDEVLNVVAWLHKADGTT